jgi:elongation factor G
MEGYAVIRAEVPLKEMFGYSMTVRSLTSGQANFSMEFATYRPVPASQQAQVIAKAAI